MIIDELFEDRILSCLFRSKDFCTVAGQHLKPSYFENPVKHNLAKMAIDFYTAYRSVITELGIVEETKALVKGKVIKPDDVGHYAREIVRLKKVDVSDWKYILEKLITFIKNRETKKLIELAVKKHLPKNDFEAIESGMRHISNITVNSEVRPYRHWAEESIDEREIRREHEAKERESGGGAIGISTGIPKMDEVFHKRGWYRKELYIIMAPPKRGKTMSLLYFSNFAVWQGFNVGLFSLETAQEVLSDRVDAMNTDIETKFLHKKSTHISKVLKAKRPKGELFIYEYPTKTCTVGDIESQVRRLQIEEGIELDMLVVDYGDIMKPMIRYNDKLQEQATIFEDLRKLAGMFDVPVLTATQVNRVGTGKSLTSGVDVAGTYEKIFVADAVINLSATHEELKAGEMKIHFSESRNNERKTLRISTQYSTGRFYKEYLGSDEGED